MTYCKKEHDQQTPASSSIFPLQVGNFWKYRATNSADTAVRFPEIKIERQVTLQNGREAFLMNTLDASGLRDTSYVMKENTDIVFYHLCASCTDSLSEYFRIKYPLSVNQSWRSSNGDTLGVVAIESISVPAGTFNSTYKIHGSTIDSTDQAIIEVTYWFKENTGLVKLVNDFTSPAVRQVSSTWELMEYKTQ